MERTYIPIDRPIPYDRTDMSEADAAKWYKAHSLQLDITFALQASKRLLTDVEQVYLGCLLIDIQTQKKAPTKDQVRDYRAVMDEALGRERRRQEAWERYAQQLTDEYDACEAMMCA